jgi:hypothetical protein
MFSQSSLVNGFDRRYTDTFGTPTVLWKEPGGVLVPRRRIVPFRGPNSTDLNELRHPPQPVLAAPLSVEITRGSRGGTAVGNGTFGD